MCPHELILQLIVKCFPFVSHSASLLTLKSLPFMCDREGEKTWWYEELLRQRKYKLFYKHYRPVWLWDVILLQLWNEKKRQNVLTVNCVCVNLLVSIIINLLVEWLIRSMGYLLSVIFLPRGLKWNNEEILSPISSSSSSSSSSPSLLIRTEI